MTVCSECGYPYDPEIEEKYNGVAACPQCGCEETKEADEDYGKER